MECKAGERLTASYANFLINNGQIISPLLDKQKDHKAKTILEYVFLNYKVIGVKAREILLEGGNIHCNTQQIPAIYFKLDHSIQKIFIICTIDS